MQILAYKNWAKVSDIANLAQLAIGAAISCDWPVASKINQKILGVDKNNTEALNRLAKAHLCLGEEVKAKTCYEKVLKIDPYNIIATKNLEKISKINGKTSGNGNGKNSHYVAYSANIFLVEPGKTKIINLLNLASPAVLATLNCGDQVHLNPKKHSVCIHMVDGGYLGALPDDLAHRLINFIAGGNKYEAYIKVATTKTLCIFIREVFRSSKFVSQPSFIENRLSPGEEKSFTA